MEYITIIVDKVPSFIWGFIVVGVVASIITFLFFIAPRLSLADGKLKITSPFDKIDGICKALDNINEELVEMNRITEDTKRITNEAYLTSLGCSILIALYNEPEQTHEIMTLSDLYFSKGGNGHVKMKLEGWKKGYVEKKEQKLFTKKEHDDV